MELKDVPKLLRNDENAKRRAKGRHYRSSRGHLVEMMPESDDLDLERLINAELGLTKLKDELTRLLKQPIR